MYNNGLIWLGNTDAGEQVCLLPGKANRHGLVAGATGTGKTVTLKVMAESFSDMGVPVFMADVKGDLASIMKAGTDSEDMQERIRRFGLAEAGFNYQGYPVNIWDIYGKNGIQLRTTISEMGPMLLSRILNLNALQTDLMSVIFKIADDNNLLLIDTKDLKSMLNYVQENAREFAADYGRISAASIGAITRALVALETEGADVFFGETALNISDWMTQGMGGKGMINILDSESLIKPKMVFFFDEAHLLFRDVSRPLLDKIEQVVRLIRSKGVGVYFCTQNPRDIPDSVLAQLGNKVQHGLRAYTPADQKAVKAAAQSFRENPAFDTYETILALGTGEAVVSVLDESGIPTMAQKVNILPPQSRFGAISEEERSMAIRESILFTKYAEAVDPDSAYEFLLRMGMEQEEARQREMEEKAAAKQAELEAREAAKQAEREEREAAKQAEREEKEKAREEAKAANAKKRAAKSVGNTVAGTVGREVGKTVGKKFGSFGKTLGGNIGASLGRGIIGTLFRN